MLIFSLMLIAACLYGMKIAVGDGKIRKAPAGVIVDSENKWNDYLSKEKTGAIKGIFVIMVLVKHYTGYYVANNAFDAAPKAFLSSFAQLVVTMFLFYSGYGIMESVKKKGGIYVKNLPVQRILKLLFDFDLAVLVYFAAFTVKGNAIEIKRLVLSLLAWNDYGNSNWYIFAILCLYAFSFIAFSVFKKNHYVSASVVTVLCIAYFIVIKNFKDVPWYNTVICYPLGIWYSLFREKIDRLVQRNTLSWLISFAVCAAVFALTRFDKSEDSLIYEIGCIAFVLSVVFLSMKVSLDNKFLRKSGELVFGVYILQKLPMLTLRGFGMLENHIYLSFVITFVLTFVMAIVYNYITKLTGKLFAKFRI